MVRAGKHTAKYDGIGRSYFEKAAQIQQEYESTIERAKAKLEGIQQRRQARGRTEDQIETAAVSRRQGPRNGKTARRLFGADADGAVNPTVKSIRGAS